MHDPAGATRTTPSARFTRDHPVKRMWHVPRVRSHSDIRYFKIIAAEHTTMKRSK